MGGRLKLRNVRVPLTNPTQLRVAPGESTPNSRAGHAPESVSTVRLSHLSIQGGLARQVWTKERSYVSVGPGCFENSWGTNQHTHVANINHLGPPLESYVTSQVRQGGPIAPHTRLGTLVKKQNTRNSGPR